MVNVRGPLFSLDARGSLKLGITYRHGRKGVKAMFKQHSPDARTAGQLAHREDFRLAFEYWKGLTEGEKQAYRDLGEPLQRNGCQVAVGEFLRGRVGVKVAVELLIQLDDTTVANNKGRAAIEMAFTVESLAARCGVDGNTNVTADATFTVKLNGTSKGTVTISNGQARGTNNITDFDVAVGDRVTVDHTAGNSEGTVFQVVLVGKKVVTVGT